MLSSASSAAYWGNLGLSNVSFARAIWRPPVITLCIARV